jgi:hypothetical protein
MTTAAAPARRTLIVLLSVIGVLVIAALIVVFTRSTPALLDQSTPEGVVQRYSAAVIDGDEDAAVEYLTDDQQERCGTVQNPATGDIRVTLSTSEVRGESADVNVLISQHNGDPFGSEYTYEEFFRLEKADEGWRVDTAPWELTVCLMDGAAK